MPNPPPHIQHLISLLAWVTPAETKEFYSKLDAQAKSTLEADTQRETWKDHPLYADNTREELEKMCRSLKIPVKASVNKHQLASLICEESPSLVHAQYTGAIGNIPKTVSAISHLPVAKLREILVFP